MTLGRQIHVTLVHLILKFESQPMFEFKVIRKVYEMFYHPSYLLSKNAKADPVFCHNIFIDKIRYNHKDDKYRHNRCNLKEHFQTLSWKNNVSNHIGFTSFIVLKFNLMGSFHRNHDYL